MRSRQAVLILSAAAISLCGATSSNAGEARRRNWQILNPDVGDALHAFRQTDHPAADAMRQNSDGDQLGRNNDSGLPFNFDPLRHLLFIEHDLNRDRVREVFLFFSWVAITGNQQGDGVVMQRRGETWRLACDFSDWGTYPGGGIRLLPQRDFGWQRFRVSWGTYGWRPVRGEPGAMECVLLYRPGGRTVTDADD